METEYMFKKRTCIISREVGERKLSSPSIKGVSFISCFIEENIYIGWSTRHFGEG